MWMYFTNSGFLIDKSPSIFPEMKSNFSDGPFCSSFISFWVNAHDYKHQSANNRAQLVTIGVPTETRVGQTPHTIREKLMI